MRPFLRRCADLLVIVAVAASVPTGTAAAAGPSGSLATRSFTDAAVGSDPGTLAIVPAAPHDRIVVDLSAIAGATVHRATLDPYVDPASWIGGPTAELLAPYDLRDAAGRTLELLPPRRLVFDATQAVRDALDADASTVELEIVAPGRGFGPVLSLDVLCDRPAPVPVAQVTGAAARVIDGDVLVTFDEIDPAHGEPTWTVGAYDAAVADAAPARTPKRRYRIYRSTVPFDGPEAVAAAVLVDEIAPHSGWNGGLHAFDPTFGGNDGNPIPMLPVDDLVLAAPGTGIAVHRVPEAHGGETAYYLVSHAWNGAEDFSFLAEGANATGAVAETTGPGATLRWRTESIDGPWFFSTITADLVDVVRWPAPPDWPVPSRAFNYRFGIPTGDEAVANPPLVLSPHAWGGSYDGWRPWYGYDRGAVLVTMNAHFYNSYTALHAHALDLRPWSEGSVQPFFWARVLDAVHAHAVPAYGVDLERVFLEGASMGGAAGVMFGLRSGGVLAYVHAAVGNVNPSDDYAWEYEQLGGYGLEAWQLPYDHPQLERFGYPPADGTTSVWGHFDNEQWLHAHPQRTTPYLSFGNAPNDSVIAWEPVWRFVQAMRDTGRPFDFTWGQNGHGQWAFLFDRAWRAGEPLPAFANAGSDDDLGDAPWTFGDDEGQWNRWFRWEADVPATVPDRWAIELRLDPGAPASSTTADLVLRDLPAAFATPGATYDWTLRAADGTTIASGTLAADDLGLLRWTGLGITTAPRTLELALAPASCPADLDGDGTVGLGDVLVVLAAWGGSGGPGSAADLDGSGSVDFGDLTTLLAAWGVCT